MATEAEADEEKVKEAEEVDEVKEAGDV